MEAVAVEILALTLLVATGPPPWEVATEASTLAPARIPTPVTPSTCYAVNACQPEDTRDTFPAFSKRLRGLLIPEKFKPLGISKYDSKQDPRQWLHCYAMAVANAGGDDDTKCIYFPFCVEQEPLTWLKSLEKDSIDNWGNLKKCFTSNFTGALGRHGTQMDLAQVKQMQGETLRDYMRLFFDKRASVVDVTDKSSTPSRTASSTSARTSTLAAHARLPSPS